MNLYFIGRGIVLKGIVKYYGSGKNIPRTFGHTGPLAHSTGRDIAVDVFSQRMPEKQHS
jgi:hypothetical protein